MKNIKLTLVFALNFLICNSILGQPSELTTKVCNNLDLNIEDCYLSLVSQKVMPSDPSKSIIVLPKIVEKEDDYFILDSYILIVENITGKILSKYFESHTTNNWTSDAIEIESIKVDTAPYNLNKSTRAFGIRVSYSGPSRVNPYSEETLSLFIEREEKIIPVLTETTNVTENEDCVEKEIIKTVKGVLKYDGKEYKNVL